MRIILIRVHIRDALCRAAVISALPSPWPSFPPRSRPRGPTMPPPTAPTPLPKVTVTAEHESDGYLTERSRTATKTDTPLLNVPQAVSRRDERPDQGPVHAERGGPRPLCAGRRRSAGRGQPRHDHPARQQLDQRLLPRRRARRRRVLPRFLQHRPRRDPEGPERDDLRPRRRGRDREPRDAPGELAARARAFAAGRLLGQPARDRRRRRRRERPRGAAHHGPLRGFRQLPRRLQFRAHGA